MGNEEFAVDQIDFNIQEELGPLLSRSVLESLNDTLVDYVLSPF